MTVIDTTQSRSALTSSMLGLLEIALQTEDGNPWPLIGVRQRSGGAKHRMFERMQRAGLFDHTNCITDLGRHAFLYWAARQRIPVPVARLVRRMIHHPDTIADGTYRCWACGQIDDEPYHQAHVCRAARRTYGFYAPPNLTIPPV